MKENCEHGKSIRIEEKLNRFVRGRGMACLIQLLRHCSFEEDLERDEKDLEEGRKGMIRFEGEPRRWVQIREDIRDRKGGDEVVEVRSDESDCCLSESGREI